MSDIKKIKEQVLAKLSSKLSLIEVNQIKSDLFGKNGIISLEFKKIGQINESERKKFASDLNETKSILQTKLDTQINQIEEIEINEKLNKEKIDVTLPPRTYQTGKIHPVSQTIDEISSIFSEIGFSVEEGPDIENEYNNFTALNMPDNHPARDMDDTFYLADNKQKLLVSKKSSENLKTTTKEITTQIWLNKQ